MTFRTAAPQVPASPIFSLQIDPPPDPVALMNNPIMMMFDVVRQYHSKNLYKYGLIRNSVLTIDGPVYNVMEQL